MVMGTEAYNIVMPLYKEEFQYTMSRRPTYWGVKDKLPKYIVTGLEKGDFAWKKNSKGLTLLFDVVANEFVVKNSKSVDKPRMLSINSQILWSGGTGSEWKRTKIKDLLRAEFVTYIARQLPLKLFAPKGKFIQIEFVFFYPFKSKTRMYQDYINHWFIRQKVFEDTLTDMKVIEDDNPNILRGGYGRYVDIEDPAERRLEIKIHFCNNYERIS
jgi:hypothetical protein